MLPTFIIIGAAKCGTTSLSAYLRRHPQVFVTEPKEPHFFSHRWKMGLAWYEGLFQGSDTHPARGEASTSYTQAPHPQGVPERIASVVPDAKLIYLLRNPVERIRSQYVHFVDRGREDRPLHQAVAENPIYLDSSRYAFQIETYLEHFDRQRLLVLSSEDLRHNRRAVLRRVFDFIGVDPQVEVPDLDRELNRSADKRQAPSLVNRGRRALRRTALSTLLPQGTKRPLQKLLSRPIRSDELGVPLDIEEAIWKELGSDLSRLRGLVGPEFDLWGQA
jgi:hypothetical protein